jgi:hypothetical protein
MVDNIQRPTEILDGDVDGPGKQTGGVANLRLNDIVKDREDCGSRHEGTSASLILSREVDGAYGLLDHRRLASLLKEILSCAQKGSFGGTCSMSA